MRYVQKLYMIVACSILWVDGDIRLISPKRFFSGTHGAIDKYVLLKSSYWNRLQDDSQLQVKILIAAENLNTNLVIDYSRRLNKVFDSKFCVGSWVRHETSCKD